MPYVERLFSVSILAVVLTFFLTSFQYEMFLLEGNGIGVAFLPRLISLMLLILISIYIYSVFNGKLLHENRKSEPFIKSVVAKQISMVFSLLLCLFLIDILGMISTLGVFLIGALHYIEKVSWVRSIIFSVLTIISLYFIFVKWLNIILPSGFLI